MRDDTVMRVSDHVPYPGGRYIADGPYSGEWFRETFLRPALENAVACDRKLTVELDGVPGYGISFLEEGFGGLIRENGFSFDLLRSHLSVRSSSGNYDSFERIALTSLVNAARQKDREGSA